MAGKRLAQSSPLRVKQRTMREPSRQAATDCGGWRAGHNGGSAAAPVRCQCVSGPFHRDFCQSVFLRMVYLLGGAAKASTARRAMAKGPVFLTSPLPDCWLTGTPSVHYRTDHLGWRS